ncbi:MAG: DNA topoisomerase, partial [Candidatus Weimeria sp.]
KMGYTSAETLKIIQSLYEKKFVSYPRTDCEYLSSHENFTAMLRSASCVAELAPYVSKVTSADITRVRGTKKWINDAKLKESGHSALVPTTNRPDLSSLSSDERAIYTLIAKQFVAAFLAPLVQEKTELVADIGGKDFKSSGKTLVDKGYTELFGTKFSDNVIPEHKEGDVLDVSGFSIAEKTSQCPKRFSDADLISVCEAPAKFLDDKSLKSLGKDLKIGTPATRAGIIEQLINRDHYLKRQKEGKTEKIVPTEAGMEIYENLKDFEIAKVDMTGHWEMQLEAIREGKMALNDMEQAQKKDVERMINEIRDSQMKGVSQDKKGRTVIGVCPECGGSIISAEKNFYCSNYREGCKVGSFKKICDSKITDREFLLMLSGNIITKEIKKGTSKWKQRLKYDPAEHRVTFVEREKTEVSEACPCCGKNLIDDGVSLSCSCGFKLYKTQCKKKLMQGEIKKILEGGEVLVDNLVSKKGKKFSAYLKLSDDKKKIEYRFPER